MEETPTTLERKRPVLKPLLLVERVRSRSERERGSSSGSAHSSTPTSPNIERTALCSSSRQGSMSMASPMASLSPTLPTPPGTPTLSKVLPEVETLEQLRSPFLRYHLPFRPIQRSTSLEFQAAGPANARASCLSQHANQVSLVEELNSINQTIELFSRAQSNGASVAELGDYTHSADHRGRLTESSVRVSPLQITKKKSLDFFPTSSPPSFHPLASSSPSRSRTDSSFSQSSWSTNAPTATLSPTDSMWPNHPLRRDVGFNRSISCDSRGSYGTFGAEPNALHSRGTSFLDHDSVVELVGEEENDGDTPNVTPKIPQDVPAMVSYRFPPSVSPVPPPSISSVACSDLSIQESFKEEVVLTATRVRMTKQPSRELIFRERDRTASTLSSYVFPTSAPLSSSPMPNAIPSLITAPISDIPTRQRVLSSPAAIRFQSTTTGRRALELPTTPRPELRRVVLPSGPFINRIDSPRLAFKATPTPSPKHSSPSINAVAPFISQDAIATQSVIAPFAVQDAVHPDNIPPEAFLRRGSAATVDSRMTATSVGTAGSKTSKLRRMAGLLNRLFERRGSNSNAL